MKSEWNRVQVGMLCSRVSSGGTPKSTRSEYYGGTIPWLNTREVNFNRISKTEGFITQAGLDNSSAKWIKKNCVIVAMYGATAGRCAITKIPLTTNQACCNLEIDDTKADYRFVYYALKNEYVRLSSAANGGAQQNLNAQQVKEFDIPYPPLPIQRKIASILSTLDDKIETNNAICRNLEEQAMAGFKRCFFTPSEQQVEDKPVYDLAEYINGAAFKQHEYGESGLPIIKIAELKSGLSSSTLFYSGEDKDEKYYIQNGDILFSWSGNPETSIDVFIWTRGMAILNQHIFNVKSRYGAKWFTYLMLKNYIPVFAKIASDKQTTGLGHVTVADLKRLTFPYDINQILDFEKEVSIYLEQVYNTLVMNNHLSNLRDTLLPKLMSGELKVETLV